MVLYIRKGSFVFSELGRDLTASIPTIVREVRDILSANDAVPIDNEGDYSLEASIRKKIDKIIIEIKTVLSTSIYSYGDIYEGSEISITFPSKEERGSLNITFLNLLRTIEDVVGTVDIDYAIELELQALSVENNLGTFYEYSEGILATTEAAELVRPKLENVRNELLSADAKIKSLVPVFEFDQEPAIESNPASSVMTFHSYIKYSSDQLTQQDYIYMLDIVVISYSFTYDMIVYLNSLDNYLISLKIAKSYGTAFNSIGKPDYASYLLREDIARSLEAGNTTDYPIVAVGHDGTSYALSIIFSSEVLPSLPPRVMTHPDGFWDKVEDVTIQGVAVRHSGNNVEISCVSDIGKDADFKEAIKYLPRLLLDTTQHLSVKEKEEFLKQESLCIKNIENVIVPFEVDERYSAPPLDIHYKSPGPNQNGILEVTNLQNISSGDNEIYLTVIIVIRNIRVNGLSEYSGKVICYYEEESECINTYISNNIEEPVVSMEYDQTTLEIVDRKSVKQHLIINVSGIDNTYITGSYLLDVTRRFRKAYKAGMYMRMMGLPVDYSSYDEITTTVGELISYGTGFTEDGISRLISINKPINVFVSIRETDKLRDELFLDDARPISVAYIDKSESVQNYVTKVVSMVAYEIDRTLRSYREASIVINDLSDIRRDVRDATKDFVYTILRSRKISSFEREYYKKMGEDPIVKATFRYHLGVTNKAVIEV